MCVALSSHCCIVDIIFVNGLHCTIYYRILLEQKYTIMIALASGLIFEDFSEVSKFLHSRLIDRGASAYDLQSISALQRNRAWFMKLPSRQKRVFGGSTTLL